MGSKQLRLIFENLIEEIITPFDYVIKKNKYGEKDYHRSIGGGHEKVYFMFAYYGDILSIKPSLGINFEKIVSIYQKNSDIKSRPLKCVGNHLLEIERFIKKGESTGRVYINHRWEVSSVSQVEELADTYEEYFKNVIQPYFQQAKTIARVDELLNETPSIPSIHNKANPLRACVAIIAAKLNENPKFSEILSVYDESIKKGPESYQNEYKRIRQYLLENL